jgi:hypothetical protein
VAVVGFEVLAFLAVFALALILRRAKGGEEGFPLGGRAAIEGVGVGRGDHWIGAELGFLK